MNWFKLQVLFHKMKQSTYDEKIREEILEEMEDLFNANVTLTKNCRECHDRQAKNCARYNKVIDDLDIVPEWCSEPVFKDLMRVLDKVRKDDYINAHAVGGKTHDKQRFNN